MHTVARIGLIILTMLVYAACLIQPIPQQDAPSVISSASDQETANYYMVNRGDSLSRIASQYGTTRQAIIDANQLESRQLLYRAQLLNIPYSAPVGTNMTTQAVPAEPIRQSEQLELWPDPDAEETAVLHVVHRGDSPYTIAKHYGIPVDELVAVNDLQGSMLFRAQKLIIPPSADEVSPQFVASILAEPADSSNAGAPTPDTETVTATATISVETPVTATDVVTVTDATTDKVSITPTETAPVVLRALDEWTEPDSGIAVFSPRSDGAYRSPIEIIGLANAQGGIVNLRLLDNDEQVLAWRVGVGKTQEGLDFFHTSLRFTVEEPTEAALRISETSVADGSRLLHVEVPVVLLPGQRAIDLRNPSVGSVLCGSVPISGYSDTSQAKVTLELRTPDGDVIGAADTIGGHDGAYRDFFALLDPEPDEPQALLVSASAAQSSGENGSLDETVVPITLYPAETEGCP